MLAFAPQAGGTAVTHQLDREIFEMCDRAVEWKISYQTVSATDYFFFFCVCVCAKLKSMILVFVRIAVFLIFEEKSTGINCGR